MTIYDPFVEAVVEAVAAQFDRKIDALADRILAALPPRLGSVEDAAEALHVSRRTVCRMIAAGRLPVVRVGRRVLVDLGALRPPDPAALAREARTRAAGPMVRSVERTMRSAPANVERGRNA